METHAGVVSSEPNIVQFEVFWSYWIK
jgi:hypothetical protein